MNKPNPCSIHRQPVHALLSVDEHLRKPDEMGGAFWMPGLRTQTG